MVNYMFSPPPYIVFLSIFDLIFRVFVSNRSAYCFVRKVLLFMFISKYFIIKTYIFVYR